MKELALVALGTALIIVAVRVSIPSNCFTVHVGKNMNYDTELDKEIREELLLLKQQNGN